MSRFSQDYCHPPITPRKNHSAANFLSRHPLADKGSNDNSQITIFSPERFVNLNYMRCQNIWRSMPQHHSNQHQDYEDTDRLGQKYGLPSRLDPKAILLKSSENCKPNTTSYLPTDEHWTLGQKMARLVVPPLGLKRKLMYQIHTDTQRHPWRMKP